MTKGTRPFGFTGPIVREEYPLPEGFRRRIREIKRIGPRIGVHDLDFFDHISMAIASFRAQAELAAAASVNKTRSELSVAHEQLGLPLATVEGFCGNAMQMCDEGSVGYLAIRDALRMARTQLADAMVRAQEYKLGRPIDYPGINLCIRIADIIEKHLSLRVVTTKGGWFEEMMVVVLEAAADREYASCNDLIVRAMRLRRGEKNP